MFFLPTTSDFDFRCIMLYEGLHLRNISDNTVLIVLPSPLNDFYYYFVCSVLGVFITYPSLASLVFPNRHS